MTAIGFGHHNHAGCIADAMQAAEESFEARKNAYRG